jgi:uncharacterized protein (TIGR03085 family)
MSRYARIERNALADALLAAGPDAPTLCEGWTTSDLAAHVVVRDRRPDTGPGIMIRAFADWTDRVRIGYRDGHPYPELVAMVRSGPRWSPMVLPALDELTNMVEFFVHTEDVRRGRPGWEPRPLDADLAARLWQRTRALARLHLRRFKATVRIECPGYGTVTTGAGGPAVTLTGEPGELMMFLFGRQRAARVEATGPDDLVAKLVGARFGV